MRTQAQQKDWINLWEFEDPKFFPEAIISRFLKNIRIGGIDSYRNVISHFHESANDNQIRRIIHFFDDSFYHWGYTKFGKSNHFEILVDVYFGNSDLSTVKKIIFGIEPDLFFREYRIVGVRLLDSQWKIKKTIFAVDQSIYNWRTDQPDFTKPLDHGMKSDRTTIEY